MWKSKPVLFIGILTAIALIVMIGLAVLLVPGNKPAFDVAVKFINAAGLGDDETAFPLLSEGLQAYVIANCPDGSVSACVLSYTPAEWGGLLREGAAVYRRSIPDGDAWDVQLVATYKEDKGFSGVCIYNRVEEVMPDDWRITAWSGFVPCDEPEAGLQGLRQPDAPNRAP